MYQFRGKLVCVQANVFIQAMKVTDNRKDTILLRNL
jgi:hypothetical protein